MPNPPLRVYIVFPSASDTVEKNPSPVIARSSDAPVCSIGPTSKFCVIESTDDPIPTSMRGSALAEPATRSAKLAEDFLNPLVSALAMLWAVTFRPVWAFFSPLSEV